MEKDPDGDDVIVEISGAEEKPNSSDTNGEIKVDEIEKQDSGSYSFKKYLDPPPLVTTVQAVQSNQDAGLRARKKAPSFKDSSPSTIETSSTNPVAVLKADEDTTRISLAQSPYPKPKSRIIEPVVPVIRKVENDKVDTLEKMNTPKVTPPITPRTPLLASPGEQDDDDEEVYFSRKIEESKTGKRSKKIKVWLFIEFSIFVCITVVLILSRTVDKMNRELWSLGLWKWCVLVLVIFCGRLFSEWFTDAIVFLIEKEFLFRKKVLYFVYSLQKSVRVFIWIGLILLTWGLLINRGVHRSRDTTKILNYITRGIASTLVGAGAWILKTLFVKILASSFHVKIFFDRIQESIFHQYVLQTLSGPPLVGDSESIPSRQLSFKSPRTEKGGQRKEKIIDVQKLQKMKRGKVSAWTMKGLMKIIGKSGFSTLADALDESADAAEYEQKDGTITCEWEAQNASDVIFRNVAKHGHK